MTTKLPFSKVNVTLGFKTFTGAIRRSRLWSSLSEYLLVTVRTRRVAFFLKGAALIAAILAISLGISVYPPAGLAKNSIETVTDGLVADTVMATAA